MSTPVGCTYAAEAGAAGSAVPTATAVAATASERTRRDAGRAERVLTGMNDSSQACQGQVAGAGRACRAVGRPGAGNGRRTLPESGEYRRRADISGQNGYTDPIR